MSAISEDQVCLLCLQSISGSCPMNVKQEMKMTNQMHAMQQCHQTR